MLCPGTGKDSCARPSLNRLSLQTTLPTSVLPSFDLLSLWRKLKLAGGSYLFEWAARTPQLNRVNYILPNYKVVVDKENDVADSYNS